MEDILMKLATFYVDPNDESDDEDDEVDWIRKSENGNEAGE